MRADLFTRFVARRFDEKKGHYKKSESQSPLCGEFPTKPNLRKICICIAVADVIKHTKFGNDWSRDYKVTEGRILPCTIGMACCLYHCSVTVLHVIIVSSSRSGSRSGSNCCCCWFCLWLF